VRTVNHEELLSTEEADSYRVYHHKEWEPLKRSFGYTSIDVLPQIVGRPWDAAALNVINALRPSTLRVARDGGRITADCRQWRVTVYLEDDNRTIQRISQEVTVGLRGCRYGQDVDSYLAGGMPPDGAATSPDGIGMGIGNFASIAKLELYNKELE